ncbi:hypothetical protein [Variovorax sp. EL159]|uniref:hypothetical protein n=1 Tax=Variovorax sp. EL159 TaxID=1566270 RepID=UPI00088BD234|nr:hypothetical protein [Variovorax sp. EL159]SCX46482.1 hypothetical protein SAMN03159363_0959 [Variovorax sp. EL159]
MKNKFPEDVEQLKPLPMGYWLRLAVAYALFIGGVACAFSYNEIVGAAMVLCTPIFIKFSGFREMHKKHKAEQAAYKAGNNRG